MFRRMLDHALITYETGVEFADVRNTLQYRHLVYTGSIDAYFDHRYGRLPYRSIEFGHEYLPGVPQLQKVATVNYPNDFDYTRVTEFKHLTGQMHDGTSIVREYPRTRMASLFIRSRDARMRRCSSVIRRRLEACADVTFVGRLAQYRYYNMDQVVGAALAAAGRLIPLLRQA